MVWWTAWVAWAKPWPKPSGLSLIHILLGQAQTEVLAQELEIQRLTQTLRRMADLQPDIVTLPAPSPFALPLLVERLREQLSTEKLKDRLDRMLAESAAVLDPPAARPRRTRRATGSAEAR